MVGGWLVGMFFFNGVDARIKHKAEDLFVYHGWKKSENRYLHVYYIYIYSPNGEFIMDLRNKKSP